MVIAMIENVGRDGDIAYWNVRHLPQLILTYAQIFEDAI
jgi:hypothetical protein